MMLNFFGLELTDEDRIFFRSVEDKIALSEKQFSPKFTFFLDRRRIALTEKVFENSHFDNYFLYGGYDGADRKILSVAPPYSYANFPEFPITALSLNWRKTEELTHRDILGSLMSLNIERKAVGDILVGKGESAVFLTDSVAKLVASELKKVGGVGVKVTEGVEKLPETTQEFQYAEKTVASMRLDCVVSAALGLSREKTAQLIKNGKVSVNYIEQHSVSFEVAEKDEFSARGFGKFVLEAVNGVSKKNRIHITIKKYI